jgi:hypothetical protein
MKRLSSQLQTIYRLTFHPDLDSTVYLNRTRLNIAAITMLILDAVYALLWLWVFDDTAANWHVLLLAAGVSALAFLNLQWRFIPKISQLAVVIFCLWLNMPVLAFYIYFIVATPVQALANTIVLLMLYMHIQDWRSSLIGVLLAAVASPLLYWLGVGHWPAMPPLLQIFILASAIGGAVVVAATSANITKMRKRYAEKVLKTTQAQLRPALQLQTELLGNMRYESRNILQNDGQRLALDKLAQDLQTQIAQLQVDVAKLVQAGSGQLGELGDWQSVGMLRTSDILRMAWQDLMANYHFTAPQLKAALLPQLQDDVVIEANGAEISQALAALLAAMLQAALQNQAPGVFHLRCWRQGHIGKLHIQLQNPEAEPPPTYPPQELPPFTAYVFRLFHISWQIHARFSNGQPADITLSCPLPSHEGTGSKADAPTSLD